MTATVIVALFSGLSAASAGAHGSVGGLLSMLSAMRWVNWQCYSSIRILILSLVSSWVSEWAQNIHVVPCLPPNSLRNRVLTRRRNIGGSLSRLVRSLFPVQTPRTLTFSLDSMIDFGFVISSFTPLVLYWMYVAFLLFSQWWYEICCCSFGPNHLRAVWRLSLGLGVVPALAVFVWRLNMDEPVRYKKDSMKKARIPYILILKRYGGSLAAISATW